jgi:hypothetical protein
MKLSSTVALLAGILGAASVSEAVAAQEPGEVTIDGFVRDTGSRPIAGVKVTLYPLGANTPSATGRSDEDGRYELRKKVGTTYDLLFSHSQTDPGHVTLLAEGKDQRISIKMYKRGEKRSAIAYNDALSAIERLLVMISSARLSERKALEADYVQAVSGRFLQDDAVEVLVDGNPETRTYLSRRRELAANMQRELKLVVK